MKKVLFVASVASHIKSFHEPYLKLLKDNGYKTYVASSWNLKSEDKIAYCDVFNEICIERNPIKISNIKAIFQLMKIIDNERFDIIHCHTPMGAVVTRLAAIKARKKYGTRVIYTAHGFHFFKGAPLKNWILFYPVEKILAKYTDTIVTINTEDYRLARDKFRKKCSDIQYVRGVGINIEKFDIEISNKEKLEMRKLFNISEKDYILTCVARLDNNKNQSFLIECMDELLKKRKDIHLLLVGRDELNGYYQKITAEKNLNKNIHFLGNRDDIPRILKISNLVVSASKREGLPVNVIEAIAANKKVVALSCRGMKDLIINEKIGYIVNSKEEFILVVNELIDKGTDNVDNDDNATLFDVNNLLDEFKKIYKVGEI